MSKTLREQLKELRKTSLKDVIKPVYSWAKDGVDHINISGKGETELGRMLSFNNYTKWNHPVLGPFTSINNVWYFLKSEKKYDFFRTDAIKVLVEAQKRYKIGSLSYIPNFRYIILDSVYRRVLAIKELKAMLLKSNLPLDSYHVNEFGVRIRFDNSDWVIRGYEEIRKALREEREPNFKHIANIEAKTHEAVLEGKYEELYAPVIENLKAQTELEEIEVPKISNNKPKKRRRKPGKPQQHDSEAIETTQESTEEAPVVFTGEAAACVTEFVEPESPVAEVVPEQAELELVQEPVAEVGDAVSEPEVVTEPVEEVSPETTTEEKPESV